MGLDNLKTDLNAVSASINNYFTNVNGFVITNEANIDTMTYDTATTKAKFDSLRDDIIYTKTHSTSEGSGFDNFIGT